MAKHGAKSHATEYVLDPDRTLCGRRVPGCVVDNAGPSCGVCKRVIRSRCFNHNRARCGTCPPDWYINGGNRKR